MNSRQQGLTLIELMISITLSMGMTLVLIQLYLQSSLFALQQQSGSRHLANTATLQHILSHSVRDALNTMSLVGSGEDGSAPAGSTMSGGTCVGIAVDEDCIAPVMSWVAGGVGGRNIASAVSGSSILQVKQSCCTDIVADQFFLAHRGGVKSNPASLYRRSMEGDGSFRSAVELVEGVAELDVSFIVEDRLTGYLSLLEGAQVRDWWAVKAVRLQARLQGGAVPDGLDEAESTGSDFSMTVASRQWCEVSGGACVGCGATNAEL